MLRLRPQQTVLSGLGVAGAVLAAVVVTFALASGIIAYKITTEAPLVPATSTLVLDPQRSADRPAKPLVLRRRSGRTPQRTAARVRTVVRRGEVSGTTTPGSADASLSAPVAPGPGSQGGGPGTSGGPAETARPVAGASVGSALELTTKAVGATTGSLGRRLEGISGNLDTQTRASVDTVLRRTAAAVARLLGGPPQG
jgi:hypothetical protein